MDWLRSAWLLSTLLALACGGSRTSNAEPRTNASDPPDVNKEQARHLIVLGTNDVHGNIGRLALLSGYKSCIEQQHPEAAVLLLDAGDLFQGTLESNLNEGASVVEIFNAIGLSAAAVGNHEFDFGPVGEQATATQDSDDPRGALKERLAQASFPFLSANLVDKATGKRPAWPNLYASRLIERAGFRVGIVGLSTTDTLRTTISANVTGLDIDPPAASLVREATALREAGAELVLGVGHLGGKCETFDNPHDLSSCVQDEELFVMLKALPVGTIDAFVGGHTHRRVAHVINGVAAIESGARVNHVGRIDIVDKNGQRTVLPSAPQPTCADGEACTYRGCDVRANIHPEVQAIADRYLLHAQEKRGTPLGVTALTALDQVQDRQSALGNLLADLILATHPRADLAIMNGGGIRAPLKKGALRYGDFFEVFPFDNRFARVEMTGAEIERLFLAELLRGHHSVLSIAGMRVEGRCEQGKPSVVVRTRAGALLRANKTYQIITSDFLATGGDGAFQEAKVEIENGPLMRDAMVAALQARGKTVRGDDPKLTKRRYPTRDVFAGCLDKK